MTHSKSPLDLGKLPDLSVSRREEGTHKPSLLERFEYYWRRPPPPRSGSDAILHINVHQVWQHPYNVTGKDIVVAVIDSGCYKHADLEHRILSGRSFLSGTSLTDTQDEFGHGTRVAGVIAANNKRGVAPQAKILPVKIYRDSDDKTNLMLRLADALEWINDETQVSIVNISLGNDLNYNNNDDAKKDLGNIFLRIEKVVEKLKERHVPVVCAAGNDYGTFSPLPGMCFPAILPQVFSVSAVHSDNNIINQTYFRNATTYQSHLDLLAPFSQRLPQSSKAEFTLLVAPGAPVDVIRSNDDPIKENGTSFSAPLVTGVIALMQEFYMRKSSERPTCGALKASLMAGAHLICDKPGTHVSVTNTGKEFYRLDALGALKHLANSSVPVG